MRISSGYNDYYKQSYALNLLSNAKLNTGSTTSSQNQNQTQAISFQTNSLSANSNKECMLTLSFGGSMLKNSLQMQGADSSEMREKMEQMRTDMDSLKTADIDNMSADEVKETLVNLQNDMKSMPPRPDGGTMEIQEADIDSMSETDMREMLKTIQEDAQNAPEMGNGMPPMPPPPGGGFDLSQMLGDVSGSQNESGLINSSSNIQDTLQQIIDNLTEAYDSTTGSSEDYVTQLKQSLETAFNNQKNNIDDFSSMLFAKLDDWGSTSDTSYQV